MEQKFDAKKFIIGTFFWITFIFISLTLILLIKNFYNTKVLQNLFSAPLKKTEIRREEKKITASPILPTPTFILKRQSINTPKVYINRKYTFISPSPSVTPFFQKSTPLPTPSLIDSPNLDLILSSKQIGEEKIIDITLTYEDKPAIGALGSASYLGYSINVPQTDSNGEVSVTLKTSGIVLITEYYDNLSAKGYI